MATESYMTNRGLQLMKTVDFDAIDFRAALIVTAVANATGKDHNFLSEVITAGTEVTATGYSRKTMAGVAVTEDDSTNEVRLAWTSIAWGALGGATNTAVAQLIIYREGASDAARDVICYIGAAGAAMPFTTNGSTVTSTTPTITSTSPAV